MAPTTTDWVWVRTTEGGQWRAFVQDRWQFQDNLTWTKGKHTFKFGGGGQYGILYRNWDLGARLLRICQYHRRPRRLPWALNSNGNIANANNQLSGQQLPERFPVLFGAFGQSATGGPGNAYRHYIMKDVNVFVNDDWKVSPRLTLNLGLRWERYGAPTEANNLIAQFTNLTGYDPARLRPPAQRRSEHVDHAE
jgi:outer membrane receptor protein involved in Fe transport